MRDRPVRPRMKLLVHDITRCNKDAIEGYNMAIDAMDAYLPDRHELYAIFEELKVSTCTGKIIDVIIKRIHE